MQEAAGAGKAGDMGRQTHLGAGPRPALQFWVTAGRRWAMEGLTVLAGMRRDQGKAYSG